MYHCRFRALTELGDPFYFSVADVPVKVYPDMFILAARSGTHLFFGRPQLDGLWTICSWQRVTKS